MNILNQYKNYFLIVGLLLSYATLGSVTYKAGANSEKVKTQKAVIVAVNKAIADYEKKNDELRQALIEKENQEKELERNLEVAFQQIEDLEKKHNDVKAYLNTRIPSALFERLRKPSGNGKDNKSQVLISTNKT